MPADEPLTEPAVEWTGISLLPGEYPRMAVELQRGLTDELEQSRSSLLLTNKRVLRCSAAGHKRSTVCASLADIDTVEMRHTAKNRQWAGVGLVFIIGGVSLAIFSLVALSSPLSPLLMAFSLALIGVVFLLSYVAGTAGELVIRAGTKDIKCKVRHAEPEHVSDLLHLIYQLKLDYAGPQSGTGEAGGPPESPRASA